MARVLPVQPFTICATLIAMDTTTVPPKTRRGRRDQGLHAQVHIQMTEDLKQWVVDQGGDTAAFVRMLIERERTRRELAAQYEDERQSRMTTAPRDL